MKFKVVKNRLVSDDVQIEYVKTAKRSGKRKATPYLVIHYTASMNYKSDVATLSTGAPKASAHLVIGREGEVVQIGDIDDILWHAGVSRWDGIEGLNSHSIGIEVTCPGYLTRDDAGNYRTWTGQVYTGRVVEAHHPNDRSKTGPKYWAAFTEKQIETLIEIGATLYNHYGMKEVVGHDMISPGRKSDPGPCMPNNVYGMIMGRDENVKGVEVVDTKPVIDHTTGNIVTKNEVSLGFFEYEVNGVPSGERLNVRDEPKIPSNILFTMREGERFNRLSMNGEWWYVIFANGKLGWAHSRFAKRTA